MSGIVKGRQPGDVNSIDGGNANPASLYAGAVHK